MRFEPALRSVSVKYTLAAVGSMAFTWADSPAAQAQSAPPPSDTFANRFSGWSFGAGGGYSVFHANTDATSSLSKGPDLTASDTFDPKRGFAVFEAGRDFRFGNVVLGLFGDVQAGSASQNFSSSASKGSFSSDLKLGVGGSAIGHAGFVVNEAAQLYGLFGWAVRHYDATVIANSGSTYSNEQTGWLSGPTVGAGAEMFLPGYSNVSLRGEYRFTYFNGPTIVAQGGGLTTTVNYGRISQQDVRAVLSVKVP